MFYADVSLFAIKTRRSGAMNAKYFARKVCRQIARGDYYHWSWMGAACREWWHA